MVYGCLEKAGMVNWKMWTRRLGATDQELTDYSYFLRTS